jgi:hypothetical protein
MDVVGHQAIGPGLHPAPPGLLGQEVALPILVALLEKDRLSPVTPLDDMVRQTENDDASETGHGGKLAWKERRRNFDGAERGMGIVSP